MQEQKRKIKTRNRCKTKYRKTKGTINITNGKAKHKKKNNLKRMKLTLL
jgi:hypothetical protein